MARAAATFPTVRSEGGLLPPDLLQRIVEADADLGGFKAEDYGLLAGQQREVREVIARAWQQVRAYWAAFQAATDDLPASVSGVTETREQWLLPLLRTMGYHDVVFRGAAEELQGRRYLISHRAGEVMPLHVASFREDLDRSARQADGQPRSSPHGLVQEYLNRSDGALYGLVTNGLVLRLLRDNHSLTRLAYVEFDLRAMLEGGVYADFVLLWLTLHRSRLPRQGQEAGQCWLEVWRDRAETRGTRAMAELRGGVEKALEALGTGLLAHPANESLRQRLRGGELSTRDFYAQLLRLLYRLLFLFVAEERDLLFAPGTSEQDRRRHASYYSLSRLRDLGRRYADDERHDDLWRGLRVVMDVLAGRRQGLGLPALAGGLFSSEACPDIDGAGPRPPHTSTSGDPGDAGPPHTSSSGDPGDAGPPHTSGVGDPGSAAPPPTAGQTGGLGGEAPRGENHNTPSSRREEGGRGEMGHPSPALLSNAALAKAVAFLSVVRVQKRWRRVNYRDMDVEELGGVYEGLLDRQPRVVVDAANPRFELVGSGERKQTGSYYTPSSLVDELVRSALQPVIADRLAGARTTDEQCAALLGISVCDTAAGSGHFLLAAARRIADELARVEAGDREPSPADVRQALRTVIRSCVYGVDVNPLAVDLCKLALWLEGHDAGRPLTFLDHRVKLGNSLVGATPELVAEGLPDEAFDPVAGDDREAASGWKKRNRQERTARAKEGERQATFLVGGHDVRAGWAEVVASLGKESAAIGAMPEAGATGREPVRGVAEQRARYEAFLSERVDPARAALDAWTAAFFWPPRDEPGVPPPPTSAALHVDAGQPPLLSEAQQAQVARLRARHRFFHWPLEFPEVFEQGGFDCVLGNPPWERIKLQEQEFFAERDPEIAKAPSKAARQRLIETLATRSPGLEAAFRAAQREAEGQSKFVRASGRFPLTAVGDVNLYALFAEHKRAMLNDHGRAGVIVPTGIATDDSTKAFFQDVVERGSLASLFDFENRKVFFEDVHASYKFCLLVLAGGRVARGDLAFFLTGTDHLKDERRRFQLSAEDFALLNPNTRTCPVFRTRADADLTRAIYTRVPVLVDERLGLNPWGVQFLAMFHMSNDSGLFCDAPAPGLVPLYEAKLFHQFNHRWATYANGDARDATPAELADPAFQARPRYWVEQREVEARLRSRWDRPWLLAFRDIARATDERTAIFSVLPRVGVGHKGPLLLPTAEPLLCGALYGCVNSLTWDYVVRQKIGGTSLGYFVLKQLPVLPPTAYTPADLDFIVPRVLELTYTAWDLKPFAEDLGYDGPPFGWDEARRALLRAELDAYYAALYGLTRDELRYILDPRDVYGPDFPGETFRVLKERETKQYGEYRTRRLVVEAWDRLGLAPRNRDGRYEVAPAPHDEAGAAPGDARADASVGRRPARPLLAGQTVSERQRTPVRPLPLPTAPDGNDSHPPATSPSPPVVKRIIIPSLHAAAAPAAAPPAAPPRSAPSKPLTPAARPSSPAPTQHPTVSTKPPPPAPAQRPT